MFTGIIQNIGEVVSRLPARGGMELGIRPLDGSDSWGAERTSSGDSIAVNGACLTVVGLKDTVLRFDLSEETLSKCLALTWQPGTCVNLEQALTLETPIGGHLVSGHVDGIASLIKRKAEAGFATFVFAVEHDLGRYIASKGSVAIDGVSLTSNRVLDGKSRTTFEVALVPHTLENTTLGNLDEGACAHIEVDQIARYIDRMSRFDSRFATGRMDGGDTRVKNKEVTE